MTFYLRQDPAEAEVLLEKFEEQGRGLLQLISTADSSAEEVRSKFLDWDAIVLAGLDAMFETKGFWATSPRSNFNGVGGVSSTMLSIRMGEKVDASIKEELSPFIEEKMRTLRTTRLSLQHYKTAEPAAAPEAPAGSDIFLVHGRDTETRLEVQRFLERITDRKIIVLSEMPNQGSDLLGKLLKNARDAAFAVVLLTGDDEGGIRGGEAHPRARQNVIFELGLFLGLLGREKVAALKDSTIESPTDFDGVVYISLSYNDWRIELARELKAAGIEVSLNKIL